MQITKLGHCCLLIETKTKRIMTDPGSYTVDAHSNITNIDAILFTHEHQDHFHLDSLKVLLTNNPQTTVFSNDSVSDLLIAAGIAHTKIAHGETFLIGGKGGVGAGSSGEQISVIGIGEKHAEIHRSIPLSSNLGFLIDGKLWYPGDAFTDPEQPVDILALPVAGPWMKIGEALDFAIKLKPRVAFPVHDHMVQPFINMLASRILPASNIDFVPMKDGEKKEF